VVLGFPLSVVDDITTIQLAASVEAEVLIATTPDLLRVMASSTLMEVEHCRGHIRGPVLWAETLNARANGLGSEDVFVCGVPSRDVDVTENRALVAALRLVAGARRFLDGPAVEFARPDVIERAAANAAAARGILGHRDLASVTVERAGRIRLHRVSNGRRSRQYQPAVAVLGRRDRPFRHGEVKTWADPRTAAQLHSFVLVAQALRRRGDELAKLTISGDELNSGRLTYRNWRNQTPDGQHGMLLGDVVVDGAIGTGPDDRSAAMDDLQRRAAGRRYCLVTTEADADVAVELAASLSGV